MVRHLLARDPSTSAYVVTVDLTDPRVSVHVAMAGPGPGGPWQTALLPTSEIANREGWAVAVNGDFFAADGVRDGEGRRAHYVRGRPAYALGPTVCDGRPIGPAATTRPALLVSADGTATIADVPAGRLPPVVQAVVQAVGGAALLLADGRPVPQPVHRGIEIRHPRTAVGLTRDRSHLILLVVDGYRPGTAAGMTAEEVSAAMITAGAHAAMMLDGGGSTTLVRRQGDQCVVVNNPSDGRERPVANAIGIRFDGPVIDMP